jgi:uncharacterized membrane protein YphA (DoxX/SURF4 family)
MQHDSNTRSDLFQGGGMSELLLVARLLVGLVFLAAATGKLADRSGGQAALRRFHLLPEAAVPLVALVLPVGEAIVGVLLLIGLLVPLATAAATVILIIFTGALVFALVRRESFGCRCFGSLGSERVSWFSVGRNVLLLGLTLAVGMHGPTPFSLDGALRNDAVSWPSPVELVPTVLILAAVILCYASIVRLLGLEAAEEPAT